MNESGKVNKQHDLHMRSRKQLELTGVQNVESFDKSFTYQKFKSGEWTIIS